MWNDTFWERHFFFNLSHTQFVFFLYTYAQDIVASLPNIFMSILFQKKPMLDGEIEKGCLHIASPNRAINCLKTEIWYAVA